VSEVTTRKHVRGKVGRCAQQHSVFQRSQFRFISHCATAYVKGCSHLVDQQAPAWRTAFYLVSRVSGGQQKVKGANKDSLW